jgi:hypothetical protein
MSEPLESAHAAVRRSEKFGVAREQNMAIRDAIRAVLQHAEDVERRLEDAEARLARIEEPDRPPSGL